MLHVTVCIQEQNYHLINVYTPTCPNGKLLFLRRLRHHLNKLYYFTVVKELRSEMFGQHPGYFKAVFLKQTRIIIVNIYKYTVRVYNVLNYDAL